MEQIFIGGVLALLVFMLVASRLRPSMLFAGVALLFALAGFIEVPEMLSHFSNETLITLLMLLHVSSAVEKTYFIPMLARKVFKEGSLRWSILRMSGIAMLSSAWLNNTAIVATLMGVVKNNPHFAPSKLLIPLSYAAIMGGVLTLVGTSTNLIVNSFVVKEGLPPIGFFDFLLVGAPIAVVGLAYLVFIAPHLLPNRGWNNATVVEPFFLEAVVSPDSEVVGKSIAENGMRSLEYLFLAEIVRGKELISPVSPDEILQVGDSLVFTGDVARIQELRQFQGVEISGKTDEILNSNLQEVVVRHNSPLNGWRIKDAHFRTKFDAAVVAVRRGDEKLSGKIGNVVLQTGDNLVLAVGNEFARHENLRRNFTLLKPIKSKKELQPNKSYLVVGMFLGGMALAATGVCTLFQAMSVLLFGFMGLRIMKFKQIKNSFQLNLLLMIGSALAIAQVIQEYGLADLLSQSLLNLIGLDSPWLALGAIYLATVVTTELVTNNAAAALMFPIALSTSTQLGVDHTPFIMAIAFAASASFLTPIGYQTNTMVFSVGKYRFSDYFRVGIWLSLLYGVLTVGLLPWVFPF
ncbi:MAG: SLC13 family permease [Bacteroidota bacterium]